jgi:A/G-specific adenine glycosylase
MPPSGWYNRAMAQTDLTSAGSLPVTPLQAALLSWAQGRRMHLPWRGETDPYRIWVSEIMLQQTRAAAVAPYYLRFLERFPSVQALASAPLDEPLRLWEGLGYYARARSLHAAAQIVMTRHAGSLPGDITALRALPGVGAYTAGAIASLAFGVATPALDGNGRRVLTRLGAIPGDAASPAVHRRLWDLARRVLPAEVPGAFNLALMDLGAEVCTPRSPHCAACPWSPHCLALAGGLVGQLPEHTARQPLPHCDMVAGLIWRGDQVLIARRPASGLLGGLWALPGGRRLEGEPLDSALIRAVRESLGVMVTIGATILAVRHAYTHFRITLHAFQCLCASGEPQPLAYDAWRWVSPSDLPSFAFPVTDRKVITAAL